MAERAEPLLTGPGQADAFARLEAEHDNLRAAIQFADARGDLDAALRISAALWRFWLVQGYRSEGRRVMRRMMVKRGTLSWGRNC